MNLIKRLRPKRPDWQAGAALLFIAAGFVAIAKAWDGAAGIDFAQGQIPYLLSGGAAGLGLIIVGVALMMFEMGRRDRLHLDRKLDDLIKVIEEMRSTTEQAIADVNPNGYVVAGASSYHRADCRLVTGKEDQLVISVEEAEERGLAPCRVCRPQLVES